MKVKTVDTILTTNSAGQVVESIPVLPTEERYQDTAGFWHDPIPMVEDPLGTPIRIVSDAVVLNSVGQPVAATRGKGVGAPAGSLFLRGYATSGGSLVLYGRNTAGDPTRLLGRAA